jgi:hypothetical protein
MADSGVVIVASHPVTTQFNNNFYTFYSYRCTLPSLTDAKQHVKGLTMRTIGFGVRVALAKPASFHEQGVGPPAIRPEPIREWFGSDGSRTDDEA